MLRNKSKVAVGTSLVLILFGVILGSLVNVQGPSSDILGAETFRLRNAPIVMQVGKNGEDIKGYYLGSAPGWENSHKLESFSYGLQADSETGTKLPGRASFMEMAIIRYSDGATPEFFQYILTGSVVSSVSLSGWGMIVGGSVVKDWEIILENVIFTSMAVVGIDNSKGSEGGGNLESITFKYEKITIIHTVLDTSGNHDVGSCWDVINNKKC